MATKKASPDAPGTGASAKSDSGGVHPAARTQYVYILRCADGTFYTGWTTDLAARVAAHNTGKGAKYTRSRLPAELIYHEEYDDKREAQARERAVKKLSRAEKEALIAGRAPCPTKATDIL